VIAVDTSALVAIVLGEPDAERLRDALDHPRILVSAVSLTEARMVLEGRAGLDAARDLALLLEECEAVVVAYDERHASLAHVAWQRFGRGNGHAARLNFGDCMAYATAKLANAPLLFKGDDFLQTDIASAL
jgi:ribonuclease VapC